MLEPVPGEDVDRLTRAKRPTTRGGLAFSWFNPRAPEEHHLAMVEAHKKQLAYEAARDLHRFRYPPKNAKALDV